MKTPRTTPARGYNPPPFDVHSNPARPLASQRVVLLLAIGGLLYIVAFWRVGGTSFWDPDEAHYAEATREMLQTGDWLAPYYNGRPFFDKPVLFYWLQALPMSFAPDSEAAARLIPALSAALLVAITGWLGTVLFGAAVGGTAALMLAVNPGTFGLARYAILDLPFTVFLFGGVSVLTVSMLRDRPRLQYVGYILIGLANATKGPLALVLCGLTFLLASALSAEARRRLLALHWVRGMLIAIAFGLPWPLYMFWRFRSDFVEAYVFDENIRLFATPMYSGQPGWYFYLWIVAIGMLPWTPLIVSRVVEMARTRDPGSRRHDVPDVLMWAWIVSIVVFFSLSRFKLDHYVFPASPALCLIGARAWHDARGGASVPMLWGLRLVGPVLVVAGGAMAYASLAMLDLERAFLVVPSALVIAGLASARYGTLSRMLPRLPVAPAFAMAIVFAGAVVWVIPRLEEGKVVPDVARWVATHAGPGDRVATFRLNRWNTAFRFYVDRPVTVVESDQEARDFFSDRAPYFCVMTGPLYDALTAAGVPMNIAYERSGRWVTSGRALWRRRTDLTRFVVAVPADHHPMR
jgi:4-amino-4-deoxy-L-arabinose transferase-like glycosyltransferase